MDEITIHSDASWHASSRSATWGVLLDTGAEQLPRSGYAPFYVQHTTHAELAAVVAGVEAAAGIWPSLRRARVFTDCDNVVMILNGDRVHLDPITRHLLNRIRATGIAVDGQWVKSHQDPTVSPEAAANDRCDRMARYRLAQLLTARGIQRQAPAIAADPIQVTPAPTVAPLLVLESAAPSASIETTREAVRAGLVQRFGARHLDLRLARSWAANVLERRGKVRVSKLVASELDRLLAALGQVPAPSEPAASAQAEAAA